MKLNPSVTHSFLVLLLILLLSAGCGEEMEDSEIPKIATVKIDFTLPSPPVPLDVDGPICKQGDILRSGESCFYPGTDIKISIRDDGTLKMSNIPNLYQKGQVHIKKGIINGTPINLIAHSRDDNSWEIDEIGDPGTLDVIVSTDFINNPEPEPPYPTFDPANGIDVYDEALANYRSYQPLIYNTEDKFALTESFSRDFPLDPDNPRLVVNITNNTIHDLSVHFTVLLDGEVEIDKNESLTSYGSWSRTLKWGITNE